ncbi:potassium transporter TrkA [Haloprofundus halophilus]|uniref:potassium transporter TrkA n=1 Tax=Haloprofundus halophilus TaxID=2283527 RepID=UPI001E5C88F4|nr:potassium transporter TrkA [Haloprofundus halophilus]
MTGVASPAAAALTLLQLAGTPDGPLGSETGFLGDAFYILGLAFAAAAVAAAGAFGYRWYFRERPPRGLTVLVGLSAVVLYLNTAKLSDIALGSGSDDLFLPGNVLFNLGALAAATVAAPVGAQLGDTLAANTSAFSGARELEGDVGRVVRSVGRVISVTLPEEIQDMDEYDPVADATKESLAGKTLLFPRRLTVAELRERLVARLREDYGVGHVDVDLTEDGDVEYLAVGSRLAGIGPTLAPGGVAVAVRGDPSLDASPGDTVQVWHADDDGPARVLTGELRATTDEVATLAVDETDVDRLDATQSYRLVTLPVDPGVERQFAALLRTVEETMGVVSVAETDSGAHATVGDLATTVVAVRPQSGPVEAIPARSRRLSAGDTLYVIARPDELRRLERTVGATAGTASDD